MHESISDEFYTLYRKFQAEKAEAEVECFVHDCPVAEEDEIRRDNEPLSREELERELAAMAPEARQEFVGMVSDGYRVLIHRLLNGPRDPQRREQIRRKAEEYAERFRSHFLGMSTKQP